MRVVNVPFKGRLKYSFLLVINVFIIFFSPQVVAELGANAEPKRPGEKYAAALKFENIYFHKYANM